MLDNDFDEGKQPMGDHLTNWANDYDIFDPAYIEDPFPIWDDLRDACPIAHTNRWGGSWLPTTYADVTAIARDVEHFSSRNVGVVPPPDDEDGQLPAGIPPISADPPEHTWTRRLLLPWFSKDRVAEYEIATRELCRRLVDDLVEQGHADAAVGYAQQIPVRVIGIMLGVPEDMSDTFTGWVRDVLEFAHDVERRSAARTELVTYFLGEMEARRGSDAPDLISTLLRTEHEGAPVPDAHILGTVALTLVAGVDTTWSGIGSALWHLATHADDRQRLVAHPDLIPTAVEELLRAYSPVTMARIVASDVEVGGCPMREGDRVLLNFPAANRDPDAFPNADVVQIDREINRHVAFGAGIHRCAGSNLARMEMRVAVEEWLARIPEFELDPNGQVTWAGGQVRGPRTIPVVFPVLQAP
ncbi:MAG TPA: cytochrome P450 [Ilumatobacteraceae bacterium]|nr:cytochrome P450 [Ilumatobacteraceae bacterium]